MATKIASLANSIVDRLGDIKAQIAALKETEAQLTAQVKAYGAGEYDGNLFRATVSDVAARETLDIEAAEAKLRELGVDGRWFAKNRKTVRGYTVVKVVARKS